MKVQSTFYPDFISKLLTYYYRVSQKKHSYKNFGFGLLVVFWTPLDTDLDTFGRF